MDIFSQAAAWFADPDHWQGANGVPNRLLEHLLISGVSLLFGILVALPAGIWIGHTGRAATLVVNVANMGRALPSLAIIGLVLPITAAIDNQAGFKVYPTIVAMILLAIPPILVNTYAGLAAVDRELIEAGRGMGMRGDQILTGLELPVAIPVILGGLRSAAVQVLATATLAAYFGFGGLGRYLIDGIAQRDEGQIWAGVFLVAGLAILSELTFATIQRLLTSRGLRLEQERGRTEVRGEELAGAT
jgi:osmoprotectant transport system permease protein